MVSLLLLLSCNGPEAEAPGALITTALDAPRLARRLSLDILGVLPTTEELDAVEADPSALEDLRDKWLQDPRFEARLVDLYQ